MTCENNTEIGGNYILLIESEDETPVYEIVGTTSLSYARDNPVADSTNSLVVDNNTESQYTGYSTTTLNLSGKADKRTGTVSTYPIAGVTRLIGIATSAPPCAKCKLLNTLTDGYIEGCFTFTSYAKTAEQVSLVEFTATLQNKGTVAFSGDI